MGKKLKSQLESELWESYVSSGSLNRGIKAEDLLNTVKGLVTSVAGKATLGQTAPTAPGRLSRARRGQEVESRSSPKRSDSRYGAAGA